MTALLTLFDSPPSAPAVPPGALRVTRRQLVRLAKTSQEAARGGLNRLDPKWVAANVADDCWITSRFEEGEEHCTVVVLAQMIDGRWGTKQLTLPLARWKNLPEESE